LRDSGADGGCDGHSGDQEGKDADHEDDGVQADGSEERRSNEDGRQDERRRGREGVQAWRQGGVGTSQGATQGRVVKKQTTPTKIKTHEVAASNENPQYIVESDKSGKRAAHKPQELRKRG
jgi:hypothetical protein